MNIYGVKYNKSPKPFLGPNYLFWWNLQKQKNILPLNMKHLWSDTKHQTINLLYI